jgi:chaperonin GroES
MYDTERAVDESVIDKLPQPSGYKLLVAIPKIEDKTAGGVILPDAHKDAEHTASIIGLVLKVGPDAYQDLNKFPNGPWCKEEDYVIFRSYSGTRFKIEGTEFRLINDDSVEAVVEDPRGYRRA